MIHIDRALKLSDAQCHGVQSVDTEALLELIGIFKKCRHRAHILTEERTTGRQALPLPYSGPEHVPNRYCRHMQLD
jgi:hypothetical protein